MKKTLHKTNSFLLVSAIVASSLCVLFTAAVHAQGTENMPTNLLEPAPGSENFIAVESPELGLDNKPAVGFIASYQHRPFATLACDANNDCGDDVTISQVQGTIDNVEAVIVSDILFRYNFLKRFQAGLAIPLYIWQTGFVPQEGYNAVTGERWIVAGEETRYNSYGVLGDIRLHLKARIIGKERKDGFVVSAAVIPTLPMSKWTGQGEGYAGADSMSVTPKGLVSFRKGPFRVMANLGFKFRKKMEYYSAEYGHAITFGLGAGYKLPIKQDVFDIEFFGELYGEKNVISENFLDMESAPLLFDGGAKFLIKDFQIIAGVGGGIISGIGVPQIQGMLGFSWVPTPKKDPNAFYVISEDDLDGDGVENDADECPKQPEDLDGFQDEDGCPDEDNDKDGIQDGYDSCVNEPEDKDSFRDDDGCPDLDHDEDGIKEPADQCPERAEDYDNFEDEDGCPDEDNDQDGVPDDKDFCASAKEDADGFEDEDGCPDVDNDDDGVPDSQDKCADEKETLNGVDDGDGCADAKAARVEISPDAFIFAEEPAFKSKRAIFKDRDTAYADLDIIAGVLKANNTWKLTVASHTDATGDEAADEALTKERAEAIKNYLVKMGVSADAITIEAHGGKMPLGENDSKFGRQSNNRIDMLITRPPTHAGKKESTSGGGAASGDDSMDFTEEGGDDTMDFTADDNTMDFSADDFE
ncbi:MAG: OmpA family protein [Deltaproteobacteria bacterium]|nr:OmpA family protein [Deltaproteobacteria bacterium]MBN2671521.1 OmpA family protein [Deltaproteobacteria bacterium]